MISNQWVTSDCWHSVCDGRISPKESRHIPKGRIFFCKIDDVLKCFELLRFTRRRIILITGEGDLPCDEFRQRFMPANVMHWFATNVTCYHPKVTALPLGLGALRDPVTLSGRQIEECKAKKLPRDRWLYVNFRPETNPSLRRPVFDHFEQLSTSQNWITMEYPKATSDNHGFLQNLLTHRFVLCPPGNGVDTHRMWETLVAGAIPIVLRSVAMEPFAELPILFVNRYEEVTLDLLMQTHQRIGLQETDSALLHTEFWKQKVINAGADLMGNEIMPKREWISEALHYGIGMLKRRIVANASKNLS